MHPGARESDGRPGKELIAMMDWNRESERSWRSLNGDKLLPEFIAGVEFVNREKTEKQNQRNTPPDHGVIDETGQELIACADMIAGAVVGANHRPGQSSDRHGSLANRRLPASMSQSMPEGFFAHTFLVRSRQTVR